MKEDLLEIFKHFGVRNQRDKLCEEFRELQDEIFCTFELGIDRENLLNEGVDVISLILQFLFDYGYDTKEIIDELQTRIKRTVFRKNNGYYDKKI